MATPEEDFQLLEVIGKAEVDPEADDNLGITKSVTNAALSNAFMKAITNDVVLGGGTLDQDELGKKIGSLGETAAENTGIFAKINSPGFVLSVSPAGFDATTNPPTLSLQVLVNAVKFRNLLLEEKVLLMTPPETDSVDPIPPAEEDVTDGPNEDVVFTDDEVEDIVAGDGPNEDIVFTDDEVEDIVAGEGSSLRSLMAKSSDPSESKSMNVILGATHRVITKKLPLRIRSGPSLKNKILGRMPTGTQVRVVDEFLGKKCRWHRVEMIDPEAKDPRDGASLVEKFKDRKEPMYSYGELLESLDPTPESLEITCDYKVDPKASPPDWRTLDPLGFCCFYNENTGDYNAVVELKYQSEEELEEELGSFEEAKIKVLSIGVQKLLDYYFKVNNTETLTRILSAFKGAYIPTGADGFYLDKRPGSFMRFLVAFPAKYFKALPDREEDLARMTIENSDSTLRSYHFSLSTFRDKVELVAKTMEDYAVAVEKSQIEVTTLDLRAEANRLRMAPAVIENFLKLNGYPPSKKKEYTVEIGFTADFKLNWVLLNIDDKTSFPLSKAFVLPRPESSLISEDAAPDSELVEAHPAPQPSDVIDSTIPETEKSVALTAVSPPEENSIISIDNGGSPLAEDVIGAMSLAGKDGKGTIDYAEIAKVLGYLELYPEGFGLHHVEPFDSPRTIVYLFFLDLMVEDIKREHSDMSKMTWMRFVNNYTYPIPIIKPSGNPTKQEDMLTGIGSEKVCDALAERHSKDAKTTEDFKRETREISNEDAKIALAHGRKKSQDVVGDNLFKDCHRLAERIQSLDDIYDELLNRYSIESLSKLIISNLMPLVPFDDLQSMLMEKIVDKLDMAQVSTLMDSMRVGFPDIFAEAESFVRKKSEKLKEYGIDVQIEGEEYESAQLAVTPLENSLPDATDNTSITTVSKEPVDSEMLSPPSITSKSTFDPLHPLKVEVAGSEKQLVISPTRVGKVTNFLKGIDDFGTPLTVENSGYSLLNKLPSPVRDQLTGMSLDLGSHIDRFLNQKKSILKEVINRAERAQQDVNSLIDEVVPNELRETLARASNIASDVVSMADKPRLPPNIPMLDLPDTLNTTDPMGDLVNDVKESIDEALTSSLVPIIKTILDGLCGAINDAADGRFPDFGRLKDAVANNLDAVKEAFDKMRVPHGDALTRDVAETLTGAEMSDLLEGNSSPRVKQHIKSIIRNKYPILRNSLASGAQIDDVYRNLGVVLGPQIIEIGRQEPIWSEPVPSTSGLLCDDEDSKNDYADRLSEPRASQQKDADRERLKKLAKDLSDLIDNSPFVDLPPLQCSGGESGKDPIVPNKIPSVDYMIDSATDAIFSPVRLAFANDASRFLNLLVSSESRELQEGDLGFAKHEEGGKYTTQGQADDHNQTNPRIETRVAPFLRKDLRSKSSFLFDAGSAGNFNGISLVATSIDSVITSINMSEIEAHQEETKARKGRLKELLREREDLALESDESTGETLDEDPYITEQITTLQGTGEGSIREAEDAARDKIKEAQDGQKSVEEVVTRPESVKYTMLDRRIGETMASVISREQGFRDKFKLRVTDFPIVGEERSTLLTSQNMLKDLQGLEPSDGWDSSVITSQAEAFASFITSKIESYGLQPKKSNDGQIVVNPETSALYDTLRGVYPTILIYFLTQVSRQVAASPLFDTEKLDAVQLVADPTGTGPCVQEETTEKDLLDAIGITQGVKEEYGGMCEPLGQPDNATSLFENTCRDGAIKMIVRLFMLEIMLRSIFSISQFSTKSLTKDRLFIEYLTHKMKRELSSYGTGFYNDLCVASREMIKKRVIKGHEIENLFGVVNMSALLNEENMLYTSGEEALRYLALEQLEDLIDKLKDKVGTGNSSIHNRFTSPPAQVAEGRPVRTTLRGGWVRTIDVPKSYHYGDNGTSRFQRALNGDVKLMYPDLKRSSGTFFFEKYIRVEDLLVPKVPAGKWSDIIRKRPGGPDNPFPGDDEAHLSGVVNLKEWESWIASISSEPGFEDLKISDYFKPWKYGLRLVWLPPMKPGGYRLVGQQKWQRFDPKHLESEYSGEAYDTWLEYYQKNHLYGDLLDTDEDAIWEEMYVGSNDINDEVLTLFDDQFSEVWDEETANIIARREKALMLQESIEVQETNVDANMDVVLTTTRKVFVRPVHTIPLIVSEAQLGGSDKLEDYYVSSQGVIRPPIFFDNDDINLNPRGPFGKLKYNIITGEDYKFLFNYVFPLPRMLSLVTIYTANSMPLTNPRVEDGFLGTREALRSLFYTLSPEDGVEWYEREDIKIKEEGGSVGAVEAAQSGGLNSLILQMILDTVPILIRGCAERLDPHYSQVSKLVDFGVWPLPKNWSSVPPLWPVNFFGWGPPLTALGAIAYSLPETSRDKKKRRDSTTMMDTNQEDCEEIDIEDDELDA